ncbi:23S rRNA (uracil(1939)-C(5))-methyltransferase RlmD [Kyrpidia tusciae]|uniref:RNA methyltransferase, TrmA family n=1 Tax=Kyrpidia tusciae (strain DSM 2912 / NBRC 15312 / T2) TaxID=562970 RepID=D5WUX0_KYRT2|nr:23S rRNA (uracil(1939)-C(5))-methyltransferase RlmD [Kyrpidia tusciae]ADG07442.1 RNA methyltransferase, TrmA family [Kyrpidia tusciae DSM 2912]
MDRIIPVSPGDEVDVVLHGVTQEGKGVGRISAAGSSGRADRGGFTLFVRGGLPGERVRARVTRVARGYADAEVVAVMEASDARVRPPCPVFGACGGCQFQHGDYGWQLDVKRERVREALERIGRFRTVYEGSGDPGVGGSAKGSGEVMGSTGKSEEAVGEGRLLVPAGAHSPVDTVVIHSTLGMESPWRYRNNIHMAVKNRGGRLAAGYYSSGGRRWVATEDCPIADKRLVALIRAGLRAAEVCGWQAAEKATHGPAGARSHGESTGGVGRLYHLAARVAPGTGQTMLIAVVDREQMPHLGEFSDRVRDAVPEVTSVILNVRRRGEGPIYGRRSIALYGPSRIVDRMGGLWFEISPTSFYQVNSQQAERMYRLAVEAAGLDGSQRVVDAYCGVGTLSLFLSRSAAWVTGIEVAREAVADARRNARMNRIGNARFQVGAVEEILPRLVADRQPDVVTLDPPRRGCRREVLEALICSQVPRVVYVSCDPATLARDLRILAGGGYQVRGVWPVDMFPQTGHVESVALLGLQ